VHQTGEIVHFARFMEFVQSSLPEGLGADLPTVKKLCSDDPEALDLLDRATVRKHGGDRKSEEAMTVYQT
jgi:hypothetical protein